MSRPAAAQVSTRQAQPLLQRCHTQSGCPLTDRLFSKLASATPAGRRCPRFCRRRICATECAGVGANTGSDSGFRCKRFDGACITWDRRPSRPHTASDRRIFLLRARLVDLRTGAPCGGEFKAHSVGIEGTRAFLARCTGARRAAALTAFGVLDKPAAVGTVVEAAVPLPRFPRRAHVHDGEIARLGVGARFGLNKVFSQTRPESLG